MVGSYLSAGVVQQNANRVDDNDEQEYVTCGQKASSPYFMKDQFLYRHATS
jgi:hypothetical protein